MYMRRASRARSGRFFREERGGGAGLLRVRTAVCDRPKPRCSPALKAGGVGLLAVTQANIRIVGIGTNSFEGFEAQRAHPLRGRLFDELSANSQGASPHEQSQLASLSLSLSFASSGNMLYQTPLALPLARTVVRPRFTRPAATPASQGQPTAHSRVLTKPRQRRGGRLPGVPCAGTTSDDVPRQAGTRHRWNWNAEAALKAALNPSSSRPSERRVCAAGNRQSNRAPPGPISSAASVPAGLPVASWQQLTTDRRESRCKPC